jgi:hypothetical protein
LAILRRDGGVMTRPAGVQIMAVYAVPLGTYAEGKYTGQAGGQAASFTFRIEGAAAPFFGDQDLNFSNPSSVRDEECGDIQGALEHGSNYT